MTAEIVIRNEHGLHMRYASEIAKTAGRFSSRVNLVKGMRTVNAQSMLDMMTLAAVRGTRLGVKITGSDAAEAMTAMLDVFDRLDKETV